MLALFLPNPGDVLEGSKRVKDFAVWIADGRDLTFPEETFPDILGVGRPVRVTGEHSSTQAEVRTLEEAYGTASGGGSQRREVPV